MRTEPIDLDALRSAARESIERAMNRWSHSALARVDVPSLAAAVEQLADAYEAAVAEIERLRAEKGRLEIEFMLCRARLRAAESEIDRLQEGSSTSPS